MLWVRRRSSGRSVFYRARYFDAHTGRFLSEDPIRLRAGDQNLFRYVRNNPPNFRDPSGNILIAPLVNGAIDGLIDLGEQLAENGGNTDCLDFGQAGKAALEGALNPFSKLKKAAQLAKKIGQKLKKFKKNSDANKAAQKQGFENAEALKNTETSGEGKNFNMNVDKSTGEIILVPVNKGSGPNIPTGMFNK